MVSQSKNGFPKYGSHLVVSISWFSIILWFPLNGFSIKKWFPKIWLSIKKWFPKIWFSIILWYSSRGFHLVVLNHFMVLISWFPSRGSQSFYGYHKMVSQSKNGFPKYGSHLVVSISWTTNKTIYFFNKMDDSPFYEVK